MADRNNSDLDDFEVTRGRTEVRFLWPRTLDTVGHKVSDWPELKPVSVYTKFLVDVRCNHDSKNQRGTSPYCPGYSDAQNIPFEGSKSQKLREFSDIFCSRCPHQDMICRSLFCPPDYMIVTIATALMETLCSAMSTENNSCFSEYCGINLSRRSVDDDTSELKERRNNAANVTCKPAADWSDVQGMEEWCRDNCPNGNDGTKCLTTYCDCTLQEATTPSPAAMGECVEWTASSLYAYVMGMSPWCQAVCQHWSCPATHCVCSRRFQGHSESPAPGNSTSTAAGPTRSTSRTETIPPTRSSTLSTSASTSPSTPSATQHQSTSISYSTASTTSESSPGSPMTTTLTEAVPNKTSSEQPSDLTTTSDATTSSTGGRSTTVQMSSTLTTSSPSTTILYDPSSTSPPSTKSPTTTSHPSNNETEPVDGALNVVKNVICTYASDLNQNAVSNRFCKTGTNGKLIEKNDSVKHGYSPEITERVLKVVPNLLCGFMKSVHSDRQCRNMFCGKHPRMETAIRSSMCMVCQEYHHSLGAECQQAYCS